LRRGTFAEIGESLRSDGAGSSMDSGISSWRVYGEEELREALRSAVEGDESYKIDVKYVPPVSSVGDVSAKRDSPVEIDMDIYVNEQSVAYRGRAVEEGDGTISIELRYTRSDGSFEEYTFRVSKEDYESYNSGVGSGNRNVLEDMIEGLASLAADGDKLGYIAGAASNTGVEENLIKALLNTESRIGANPRTYNPHDDYISGIAQQGYGFWTDEIALLLKDNPGFFTRGSAATNPFLASNFGANMQRKFGTFKEAIKGLAYGKAGRFDFDFDGDGIPDTFSFDERGVFSYGGGNFNIFSDEDIYKFVVKSSIEPRTYVRYYANSDWYSIYTAAGVMEKYMNDYSRKCGAE
ncbi:MAG: hypothetical protein ACUVXI_05320, partial [bacterium]